MKGLQADDGLESHLTAAGGPVLRAEQLLADLAEIYFDSPDFQSPRGVALVAPDSWLPKLSFLGAMLRGLRSSPIVTTVPIGELFATVPLGSCQAPPAEVTGCSAAVRSLSNPDLAGKASVTSGQLGVARAQLAELTSVIPTGASTIHNLEDAILLAETAGLTGNLRRAYLSAPSTTMHKLGSELGLPSGRTVTVTSSSARFPIAITSGSETPVHVILAISGPDLSSSSAIPRRAQARHDELHRPRAHTHLGRFEPAAAAPLADGRLELRTRRAHDPVHGDLGCRDRAHRRAQLPSCSSGGSGRHRGVGAAARAAHGRPTAAIELGNGSGTRPREAQAAPLLRPR